MADIIQNIKIKWKASTNKEASARRSQFGNN